MSDVPFGFQAGDDPDDSQDEESGDRSPAPRDPSGSDDSGSDDSGPGGSDEQDGPQDPLSALFGQLAGGLGGGLPGGIPGLGGLGFPTGFGAPGAGGLPDFGSLLQQIGQMLSNPGSGPVNWDLAKDVARKTVAGKDDRSVSDAERRQVDEAVRLAEVWLDGVTTLPAGTSSSQAWSRAEWVENTAAGWKRLIDPVATRVVAATGQAVPEEMRAMAGPLLGLVQQMGGAMFGMQVGQGLGTLAGEVVGSADVGLPLGPPGVAVLLPQNVAAFGEGLELPADDVRLYLALRECAHQRLFSHVPWLAPRLVAAVEDYARGIHVDTSRLEETVRSLDPSDMSALQEALQGGMVEPEDTPEQRAALARLETLLALVEGWVDTVVTKAAEGRLPTAGALRETVRRSRASGGPAEATFATLVGLELRPRRLREAAALWAELESARGVAGRDAVWQHAELMPTAEDLDDPGAFVVRTDLGDELRALEVELAAGSPAGVTEDSTGEPAEAEAEAGDAGDDAAPDGDGDEPDRPSAG